MSILPKKFHGPELKCGGPQMCPDCRERLAQAQKYGIENPFEDWQSKEDQIQVTELLKSIAKRKQKPTTEE